MSAPHPKIHMSKPKAQCEGIGGRAPGRRSGHEGGALANGIDVPLSKGDAEPCPVPPCEDPQKTALGTRRSPQSRDLDLLHLWNGEK